MKEKLSKFADGGAELLSRHGGFYLCFFLFNCLTMCLHMVSKNKTDVMLCYAAGMLLAELVIVWLLDKLPHTASKIIEYILLLVAAVP